MVQVCSVINCGERYKPDTDISFHNFPQDPLRKEKWVDATQRENFNPLPHSKICSKHFTPNSFINNNVLKKKLKKNAVPSIFNSPGELKKEITKKPSPPREVKVQNKENPVLPINEGTSKGCLEEPPIQEMHVVGDLKRSDSSMEHQRYRLKVEKKLKMQQKHIKKLQGQLRKYKKRVINLKTSLKNLKQEQMIKS